MKTIAHTIQNKPTLLYMVLLGLLFPLIYFKLFQANFISWDDAEYVVENKDVHAFYVSHFFSQFYVGNYQPLTMLSYALDWKLFGKEALGYHIENLIWHFLNTILVYVLTKQLFKKDIYAFIAAIFFAFHPTQLETVAWVAERKNVMYAFFFLVGLITYLKYLETQKLKFLIITFLAFCLSVLCKPSAIVFPLVLWALDIVYHIEFSKKSLLIKLPFLLVSIVLSFITIKAQESGKFINESHAFAIYERIGYAGYAISQYIYTFFAPVNLSVIYPYPQNKLLSIVIGYVVITLLIAGLYKLYQSKKKYVIIGLLFFIVNLLLVLQFLPFGEVLTADRYMYLPIIGLAWIVISLIQFLEKHLHLVSLTLIFILGSLSFMRASVWQNSISLYSDIVKKYPHSFVALNSLGAEYMLHKNYGLSLRYLNMAINENTNYYKGYYNRGLLFAQTNKMQDALNDFNKAIELKQYTKAYVARANVYYALKDFPKAMSDAETVLKTDAINTKANYVLANCYDDLNQLDKALNYYNVVIYNTNENPLFLLRRGIVYGKMQQFTACLNDLNACTALDPRFAEAYYWKGVVKVNMKQNPCAEFKQALDLGFKAAQNPLNTYCR